MKKMSLGALGEYMARRFLEEKKGMEFVRANYRTKEGEIDLILLDGEDLVFAEVKTRTLSSALKFGRGADKITPSKRGKIIRASRSFLREETEISKDKYPRYDAVEIYVDESDPEEVKVIHTPFAFGF